MSQSFFCTVEKYQIKGLTLGQNVTGLLMEIDPRTTLDIALKLHPETKRIIVISGVRNVSIASLHGLGRK